ncbi:MAG: TerB family tellurite resistance protein [Myxococcales bacterium]|nr:TerB family tellurite resistance protein [Myxococcales bacterium]
MNWNQLTDELSTDDALAHLDREQAEAVITALAVVMHADDRVGTLERNEFSDQIDRLPFYDAKDMTTALIEDAIAKAAGAKGEGAFKAIIDTVAVKLTDAHVREETFRMAATLAYADLALHAGESAVLGWLAAAFNLSPDFIGKVYAEVG